MSQYEVAADYLKSKTRFRPEIGIICGSGLSGLSKTLDNTETFKYEDIPGFPEATVPGHTGELVFGLLGNIECVCMKGRFHFYEGNEMEKVVLPVRVMRLMGVKLLIVTNAAGGLNPGYNVGDIMIIQDHFGFPTVAGNTPLRGHNDDALGPRFPAMSDAYDERLQTMVVNASKKLNLDYKVRTDGCYCFVSGPAYESRAECRFLRSIGGDSVGMSTVPEIMVGKHTGMKVLGLSLITNKVVFEKGESNHASHAEVLEAVEASGRHVEAIVKEIARKEILGEYLAEIPKFEYKPVASAHKAQSNSKDCATGKSCESKAGCGYCCHVTTFVGVTALAVGLVYLLKHHS